MERVPLKSLDREEETLLERVGRCFSFLRVMDTCVFTVAGVDVVVDCWDGGFLLTLGFASVFCTFFFGCIISSVVGEVASKNAIQCKKKFSFFCQIILKSKYIQLHTMH
jgi:hypothetical protein